jgi:hypothetical protein
VLTAAAWVWSALRQGCPDPLNSPLHSGPTRFAAHALYEPHVHVQLDEKHPQH